MSGASEGDRLRVTRRAVRFAVALVLGAAGTALPCSVQAQSVTGRLLDGRTLSPVVLGVVTLLDTAMVLLDRTYTDETGRFHLAAPRAGSYLIAAARGGYQPKVDGILDLADGKSITISFYLQPQAVVLDSIVVAARRRRIVRHLEMQGYYERRKLGFGHFITPDDLERRRPFDTRQLVRGIPGVYAFDDPGRGTSVRMRGDSSMYCTPAIYVDGVVVTSISGTAVIDDFIDVEHIEAVEVYPRVAGVPLQYAGSGRCGVMLFWTSRGGS